MGGGLKSFLMMCCRYCTLRQRGPHQPSSHDLGTNRKTSRRCRPRQGSKRGFGEGSTRVIEGGLPPQGVRGCSLEYLGSVVRQPTDRQFSFMRRRWLGAGLRRENRMSKEARSSGKLGHSTGCYALWRPPPPRKGSRKDAKGREESPPPLSHGCWKARPLSAESSKPSKIGLERHGSLPFPLTVRGEEIGCSLPLVTRWKTDW